MSEVAAEEHSEPPESSGPRTFDILFESVRRESAARAFDVLAGVAESSNAPRPFDAFELTVASRALSYNNISQYYLDARIDAVFTTVKTIPTAHSNMAIAESVRRRTRANPRAVTAVLSVLGYALVVGAFAGLLPVPDLHGATVTVFGGEHLVVNVLGDAIAVVNTVALSALLVGWWLIRRGDVRRHRTAMLLAFALILLFLALYLVKVNGAGEKSILASGPVLWAYLAMLAIHILLSAAAVPVVVHAVVLGLTHSPTELSGTIHPRVGRIGVIVWSLSLALGIVTYVLLNHVYGWEFRGAEAVVGVWLARPVGD